MKAKRILLIDDHSGFTRLLKLALERKHHYVVREENDSIRARFAAQMFQPDIVFCDVDMPGIDGGEVARQIHAEPGLSQIPIVFLTTLVDPSKSNTHIGGYPFLAKPVTIETVIGCIEAETAAAA